jgi:hypothetical protein
MQCNRGNSQKIKKFSFPPPTPSPFKMGLLQRVRKAVMHRNSYYLAAILGAAFVGEIVLDNGVNAAWDWNNRGVGR